jgi:sugar diacid utilization regulator
MSVSGSDEAEADLRLREQVAGLNALTTVSMRLHDGVDTHEILRLAGTAVPSLVDCRLVGAHLGAEGWHLGPGRRGHSRPLSSDEPADAELRAEIEAQLAVLGPAGGAIAVGHEEWGYAFPLRSAGGHFGFLVVSAGAEPLPAEQFLLRMLAQQSGIALANARSQFEQRSRAAELVEINDRLADTVAALERRAVIHHCLTAVAVAEQGQVGIAEALHELSGFAVAIEDRYGNLRAWAGPNCPDPYPKESPDRRAMLMRRALDATGAIRHGGRLVVATRAHDDVVGVVAIMDPDEAAGDEVRDAVQYAGTVLAMELVRLSAIAETELRLRRDLVDELLAGTADEASALARAESLGYDLERPHRVIVVEGRPDTHDESLFHAVRRAARDAGVGTLLAVHRGSVVLLADTDRPWETFRSAVGRELRGGRCRVGVGSLCDRLTELPRSHREAVFALRLQTFSGGGDQTTVFEEVGVYRLLAGVGDLEEVERFVRAWLGELLDYDADREASDLVTTLGRYLDSGGNYGDTCRGLAVHRNTLKYRLHRIREISGHDLNSPEERFHLQLAVRAWRTMQAMRDVTG